MLLTTLMFGFAASFLAGFETEALEAADARWFGWCTNTTLRAFPRMDTWCAGVPVGARGDALLPADDAIARAAASDWTPPSYTFGQRATWTYGALAVALGLGVLQYLLMLAFRLDEAPAAIRRRWWRLFQWPCHLAILLFLSGTFLFGYTNAVVARLIFTADVEMLLAGSVSNGLWIQVQWVSFAVVYVCLGQLVLNGALLGAWRWLDLRESSA